MTTVGAIATAAFDAVAAAITDAVKSASIETDTQGAYNATTGTYAITTATATGRAVLASEKPIADVFPDYVVGPADKMFLLEGFTSAVENDRLVIGSDTFTIKAVQDIALAGTVFYVVAA